MLDGVTQLPQRARRLAARFPWAELVAKEYKWLFGQAHALNFILCRLRDRPQPAGCVGRTRGWCRPRYLKSWRCCRQAESSTWRSLTRTCDTSSASEPTSPSTGSCRVPAPSAPPIQHRVDLSLHALRCARRTRCRRAITPASTSSMNRVLGFAHREAGGACAYCHCQALRPSTQLPSTLCRRRSCHECGRSPAPGGASARQSSKMGHLIRSPPGRGTSRPTERVGYSRWQPRRVGTFVLLEPPGANGSLRGEEYNHTYKKEPPSRKVVGQSMLSHPYPHTHA